MAECEAIFDTEKIDEIKEIKKHYDVFMKFKEIEGVSSIDLNNIEEMTADINEQIHKIESLLKQFEKK